MNFRHRKIWYLTMGLICLTNYFAIGIKKVQYWRKEKRRRGNAASVNLQHNVQNQENCPRKKGLFNNSIHNIDVISLRHIFNAIIVVTLWWVIRGISLSLLDKTNRNQVAMNFFFVSQFANILLLVVSPLVLLASNNEARQHIRMLFWNEWAPDFIQTYNPNRVRR